MSTRLTCTGSPAGVSSFTVIFSPGAEGFGNTVTWSGGAAGSTISASSTEAILMLALPVLLLRNAEFGITTQLLPVSGPLYRTVRLDPPVSSMYLQLMVCGPLL